MATLNNCQLAWLLSLLLLLLLLLVGQSWGRATVHCDLSEAVDAMDVSKPPCENFHEHACGNWHAPYGQRSLGAHDMRSKLRAMNKQLLVRHFELNGEQDTSTDQLASFYGSCMNGRQSVHVYMDAVQQLLPDWPLLNNASSFDWPRGNAAVRRFGAQGLWRLSVQPNWQAAEQRVFYLLPPSFELLGTSEQSEFLYQRYLKYLLLELGLRVRRAASLAEQLVGFERQLRALLPPSTQTLVLHAPQTLQELAAQLPQLQLLDYFQMLLGEHYTTQLLLVADSNYLQRLQELLQRADPWILSSWLLLQLPAHFELHLHEDASLASQRDHCLQQLNQLMPQQLSQLQLRLLHGSDAAAAAFLNRTQLQLQQLFDTIKAQFERLLNATPIFEQDAATQTLALQKLRAMRLLLSPPLSLPQQLGEAPQRVLQSRSYDSNLLHLSRAQSEAEFQLGLQCLQLPCESAISWTGHSVGPLDVNVYYRLKLNAIELPLGLLRPPLLPHCAAAGRAEAAAQLMGGLGYMIGHELIHGFDYDGINYDAAGRVAGGQWPARAIIRFGLRAGCYLGARYSNATLTINENIADSEGLRLAYEAYRMQQPANATMRPFFVAFAQNWCGQAVAPSSGALQHASHRERVNNVLGNFPEFAEAFDCKAGSPMHPPEKCRIW
ncbi:neprilysin-4 [Drosophila mojavensis]|uniref:neprilysin-4 n=1 Tax=Drosophila mojavensis TaxID=7230 RepID=UPI001CD10FAE|nr:neprilysin-4 [Drosophila mojavensis]